MSSADNRQLIEDIEIYFEATKQAERLNRLTEIMFNHLKSETGIWCDYDLEKKLKELKEKE